MGGIETVSALLAGEFARKGHIVRVITETKRNDHRFWPFEVHRHPTSRDLLSLTRWSDLHFQNNISLRTGWPLLAVNRPLVITHQTWIARPDRGHGWQDHLKRFLLRFSVNIAISHAIAQDLPVSSTVIGNPYQDSLFKNPNQSVREREIVYLGRLVSDKGVDLLLQALALLQNENLTPSLTIVGSGPEEAALRSLASELGVDRQIDFAGPQSGVLLADLLNRHRIMVVPSRWAEPFGVVALEGIACGCVVVGSEAGGLPDAIGPCGILFPNGNIPALTAALRMVLTDNQLVAKLKEAAAAHLPRFTVGNVAASYLQIFQSTIR